MPKPIRVTGTSHRDMTRGRELIPRYTAPDAHHTPPKHYAVTSHIDTIAPLSSEVRPIHPRPRSQNPKEERSDVMRPKGHSTPSTHQNEQETIDESNGATNSSHPTVRPAQAQKPTEKKAEKNNNHTNPQHPHHHHRYHMHPNKHPKNDAHIKKHTNNAL